MDLLKIPSNKIADLMSGDWQRRVSVGRWLTWLVLGSLIVSGIILGGLAINMMTKHKLRDTWAINYMNMERSGGKIRQALERAMAERQTREPEVLLVAREGQPFRYILGGLREKLRPQDIGFKKVDLRAPVNLLDVDGTIYMASPWTGALPGNASAELSSEERLWALWRYDARALFSEDHQVGDAMVFYATTSEGRVVFSNDPDITSFSLGRRPLVKQFVSAQFRYGQMEFSTGNGTAALGFFLEVPGTNVVLFSEIPRKAALVSVTRVQWIYVGVLLAVLIMAALIVRAMLRPIVLPIRDLVHLSREIAAGNFEARPKLAAVGEIEVLNDAFVSMGQGLEARDKQIHGLMEEQREKVRLEGELAITRSIQDNFLPRETLPPTAGIEMSAIYRPAEEAAGDWYGTHHDPTTGESLVIITDVSGHGAGSAMFTAMISGLFEHLRARQADATTMIQDFVRGVNHILMTLGRKKWHATMQIVRYKAGEDLVHLHTLGHPNPVLALSGTSDVVRWAEWSRDSNLLGLNPEVSMGSASVKFPPGSMVILYTDGLLEATDKEEAQFGARRLVRSCKKAAGAAAGAYIERIVDDWLSFRGAQKAADDTCVIAIRRI